MVSDECLSSKAMESFGREGSDTVLGRDVLPEVVSSAGWTGILGVVLLVVGLRF